MALPVEAKKPVAAAKAKPPVTLKHLAAALAEEHQLTKRAGEALLGDLVGKITKHLKKANASVLRVSASCRLGSGQLAWGAIPEPEKQSRSRPAKRSLSGWPRI